MRRYTFALELVKLGNALLKEGDFMNGTNEVSLEEMDLFTC